MKIASKTLIAALSLFSLATVSARAFTALEDFSSYTSPTPFADSALTNSAGAGTAGTGAAGNGWLTGWRRATTNAAPTVTIINTNPINSGGNYLSAILKSSSTTGTNDAISIARAYDVNGGSLATANSILIKFDFRVDSDTNTMRYDLFDSKVRTTGPEYASYNFRTDDGYWCYFNGLELKKTTLAFTAGVTYSFSITLNPDAKTYSFIISDGVNNSGPISSVAFRASNYETDTATGSIGGRWLTFTATETTDMVDQSTTFSFDNISITAIPEPTSSALLGGLAAIAVLTLAGYRVRKS